MTPEKDSVKQVSPCSAGREDLNSLWRTVVNVVKKTNKHVLFKFVHTQTVESSDSLRNGQEKVWRALYIDGFSSSVP